MEIVAWRALARRRILSILRKRRVASLRQLESKISEAGPHDIRPEPHHVKPALDQLLTEGTVYRVDEVHVRTNTPTPLYADPSFDPTLPSDFQRLASVKAAYETYLTHVLSPQGGRPLELVVQGSVEQAHDALHWFGGAATIPAGPLIDGRSFTDHSKLDHLLLDRETSLIIGVEDKNHREWIYPHSEYLRTFLAKCVLYDIVPLFITRRLPYISRRVLPEIGVLAFQTFHQFVAPEQAEVLALARHTDGLGFHDIRFTTEPLPTLVNYFRTTMPARLPTTYDTFQACKEVLYEYAVARSIEYDGLIRELEVFYPKSEEEEFGPDDYLDYY